MRRSSRLILLVILAGMALATTASAQSPATPETVEWRMASAFAGSAPQLGTLGKALADKVNDLAEGDFRITFVEPNVLAAPVKLFEAVSRERIDAAWSTPAYWLETDPAFALFSSVPFGPDAMEFMTWMRHGGGSELRDELYEPYGLVSLVCGVMAPEAGGWYRREVESLEDFKDLRIRAFGLGAQVLQRVGARPQLVAPERLIESLQQGTIDAVEFSMPAIDVGIGFHETGRLYYYFPGWHQQATLFEFLVSRGKWLSLSDTQRARIRIACGDNVLEGMSQGEAIQPPAIIALREKGVELRRFPPGVLNGLEKAWQEVAADFSSKSPNFRRIWTALTRFREEYRIWQDIGYLK